MNGTSPNPVGNHGASSVPNRARVRSVAGFCVGFMLLVAAAWVAWRDRDGLTAALGEAARAAWWQVALLVALPWVSWTLTSVMYWVLMNRDARGGTRQHVGLGEMHAVLASAWLMNYLPLRPGMVGRLSYHTVVNGIPLRESVAASVVAVGCGVASVVMLTTVSMTLAWKVPGNWNHPLAAGTNLFMLALPGIVCCGTAFVFRRREVWRRTLMAACYRYLDVLSWLARYIVLFSVLGREVTVPQAAAFTALSQLVGMVPFVGNGLGLREWASALLGPALPSWMKGTAGVIPRELGLSMELLHRATELVAALPVGLAGGFVVARRLRQGRNA